MSISLLFSAYSLEYQTGNSVSDCDRYLPELSFFPAETPFPVKLTNIQDQEAINFKVPIDLLSKLNLQIHDVKTLKSGNSDSIEKPLVF